MKQTINFYDFIRAFDAQGRGDSFSTQGLKALFDYLEQYESDTGEELELDVIALCCDYTEWANLDEFNDYYGVKNRCKTREDVVEITSVIGIDRTRFITQDF